MHVQFQNFTALNKREATENKLWIKGGKREDELE